ncbi:hypothetical protein EV363DRAFT_1183636, partial [Boletus edulis]
SLRAFDSSPALAGYPALETRVGASPVMTTHQQSLCRGGADMAPLDRFQADIWTASLEALDTPSTATIARERLPAINDDTDAAPASRSYHASAVSHFHFLYQVCQLIP